MLTKSGAKLLDFDLAKPQSPATSTAGMASAMVTMTSPASPITQQGALVGTYQYMSPEQVEGRDADARSDIFALGAVLYEMTTGKQAFRGKSMLSVASAILEKEPDPISAARPLTPPALEHLIKTCLAKDPEHRFQTAHDVTVQLPGRWQRGGATGSGWPGPRPERFRWLCWPPVGCCTSPRPPRCCAR
jgi:eukaryotic-like serine/threonine-protein kinase